MKVLLKEQHFCLSWESNQGLQLQGPNRYPLHHCLLYRLVETPLNDYSLNEAYLRSYKVKFMIS